MAPQRIIFAVCPKIIYVLLVLKSLIISRTVSHFDGTEIEIWAGFGLVGNTEKKLGRLGATFESGFFMFSGAKK